ncbi:MAG TPA: hypothetical protein VFL14_10360, partial [Xanthomonadales bacterium]|nr:hypothetical protein [Xanthomonadales bacterium]
MDSRLRGNDERVRQAHKALDPGFRRDDDQLAGETDRTIATRWGSHAAPSQQVRILVAGGTIRISPKRRTGLPMQQLARAASR